MNFTNNELSLEQIPRLENIVFNPISSFYLKLMRICCAIAWGVVIVAASASLYYFQLPVWAIVGILVLLLMIAIFNFTVLKQAFMSRGYALREKDVSYRRGLFFKSELTIPYRKIQLVAVAQNPLERYYELYSLAVYNASSVGADMKIRGLSQEEADRIKLFLSSQIEKEYE